MVFFASFLLVYDLLSVFYSLVFFIFSFSLRDVFFDLDYLADSAIVYYLAIYIDCAILTFCISIESHFVMYYAYSI